MKSQILLSFIFCTLSLPLLAQPCLSNEVTILIEIQTDTYGSETAWSLINASDGSIYASSDFNVYEDNSLYTSEVCVLIDECAEFIIYDSYGDGIFNPGYYSVFLDGNEIASNSAFGYEDHVTFNCDPGESCLDAFSIDEGEYVTSGDDTWYEFTADSIGSYLISTCYTNNACDTKIWVYDDCLNLELSDDNIGTIFYNDSNLNCGELAEVTAFMSAGDVVYIRIGDDGDDCNGNPLTWSIEYNGPVVGCMDPSACNYNPLASIDDGSCLPQGDPNCPNGPDLLLRQDVLESSIYLTTLNATDECLVNEGCLTGTGLRDIVRFTTHIQNIGELDYFIGDPNNNEEQFTYDNCHGHFHYDGYAEYLLYDEAGTVLPIGFKNGFCVLDLECNGGGTAQYGCSYMGITAGCGDIYDAALDCQWVDVTDVADGDYHLVTRVNWDNAPDAAGRIEKDTLNNWGQVCINLDRSSGSLVFTLLSDCSPFVDCNGTPYGSAQPDCTGECGGLSLMGDLDNNNIQEFTDAENYVLSILGNDIQASPCNDLNADGSISVYDASLLSGCLNYGAGHNHPTGGLHDHCDFPEGLVNTMDTVCLKIIGYDVDQQYIDIGMSNPSCDVVAYQFKVDGLSVLSAENLVDANQYPTNAMANMDGMVIGLSYEDSLVLKSSDFTPLCRIYYSAIVDPFVCLSEIIDVVNSDYQQTITQVKGDCLELIVGTEDDLQFYKKINVSVEPNPFDGYTVLRFNNEERSSFDLTISDAQGKVVQSYTKQHGDHIRVDRKDLTPGVYWYRLSGERGVVTGKLAVMSE